MSDLSSLRVKIKVTVLLIDDETKLLESLTRYLESKGILVFAAKSIDIAISIMNTITPDIFIVDVMMPSQSGYDFIYNIKRIKRFSTIPFIFLTAKGMTKDRIKGYNLGCRAYITKPFDPEELISVIWSIVNEIKNIDSIKEIKTEINRIRFCLEKKCSIYISFTAREKLILLEVLAGNSNSNIAKKMQISIRNVEKYVTRLLNKTDTRNRNELIKSSYKFFSYLKANDENRTRE